MSNYNIAAKPPSNVKYAWTGVAFIGLILAIGVLIWCLYFPNRLGDATEDIITQRKATLSEVTSKQKAQITGYVWIDKQNNLVRIPIEQAMKVVVDELSKQRGGVY